MQFLFSKKIDLTLLYVPLLLLWISFVFISDEILFGEFPLALWVIFVLGIDVSHVWSSLFRTYFNKEDWKNHRNFLIISPLVLSTCAFVLAYLSIEWFWRVLAYVAVFHFIKQQYGFLALYRVKTKSARFRNVKLLDKLVIYGATVIPVILWHFNPDTKLAWFVIGDFFDLDIDYQLYNWMKYILSSLYLVYLIFWIIVNHRYGTLKIGPVLWVLFTVLNWFGAIVFINSDLIFTTTNVLAHGLPYFVLMAFYKSKTDKKYSGRSFLKWFIAILFTVLLLALLEEYFWDTLLFKERPEIFGADFGFNYENNRVLRAFFFAILVLPQLWHYFVDGVIWKANDKNPSLRKIFK